jgi:ribose-phosphate pyrophosphokinase
MILTIRYPEDEGKYFEMFRYPGGEVQVRLINTDYSFLTNVHVVARIKNGEIMGLVQLTDALDRTTNADKTLILPYLPYSRADRSFTSGDCFGLSAFAAQINTLNYERVVTLDAHSEVAAGLIWNLINVSPRPIIDAVMEQLQSVTVLLPDQGANRYNLSAEQAYKHRDPATGRLDGFIVPGKAAFEDARSILIVDDICDGGGTFIGIAEQLADYGKPLYLYVTHGIFSKGLAQLGKYFKRIYTTDSLMCLGNSGKFAPLADVQVISCMATILADLEVPKEI